MTFTAPIESRRDGCHSRSAAVLATTLWLAACAAPDSATPALEHTVRGAGAPAVVFQSGLGDGLSVWKDVQARVQPHATTFAVFAQMYPGEVAGVVLLDPTHPQRWETMQREAPANAALVRVARAAFKPAMRREFDDQARCLERLQSSPMPGVPVRLLVRGRYAGLEAGAFEAMARRLEVDWARRLHAPSVQAVDGAGHYLQRDRPDVVADAIVAVVVAARPR
jgi:hypothetical protein